MITPVMKSTDESLSLKSQKNIAILVIGCLLAGVWLYLSIILKGSQHYYRDYDPEMAYFMNALAPFKGAPYFYTDHPGTPVEIVGTIILGTMYVFFPNHSSFIHYQLKNPELFLNIAHGVVTLLSILCATYFFLTVLKTSRKPDMHLALSLALLFYGLHPYSFTTLTVWSHTSFNFPLGAGYLILLFQVAQNSRDQISGRLAAGLGTALGIMIAVMINFVPWLVTTLIFVGLSNHMKRISWKQSVITGCIILLSCSVAFFVAVLPAIDRMPYFFGFLYKLFDHQLPYGNGPEGITSIPLLQSNLHDVVASAPLLFFVMLAGLLLTLFLFLQDKGRIPDNQSLWALGFALLLQCGIVTLAVLKHPGERFLLQLAATLPVLLLVLVKISNSYDKFNRWFSTALIFFSILSISVFASVSVKDRNTELRETRATETEINQAIVEREQFLNKKPQELLIMRTNATYSYCSALLYGDFFTSGVFATETNALCPSQVYFFYHYDWVLYQGDHVAISALPWKIMVTTTQALANNPAWKEKGTIYDYPYNISLVINEK